MNEEIEAEHLNKPLYDYFVSVTSSVILTPVIAKDLAGEPSFQTYRLHHFIILFPHLPELHLDTGSLHDSSYWWCINCRGVGGGGGGGRTDFNIVPSFSSLTWC